MADIEKLSDVSSEENDQTDDIADMILDGPMYYILSQFLETDDHKNIATILSELVTEMREIKGHLAQLASSKSPSSSAVDEKKTE